MRNISKSLKKTDKAITYISFNIGFNDFKLYCIWAVNRFEGK